jgi:hypothetical protein
MPAVAPNRRAVSFGQRRRLRDAQFAVRRRQDVAASLEPQRERDGGIRNEQAAAQFSHARDFIAFNSAQTFRPIARFSKCAIGARMVQSQTCHLSRTSTR